MSTLIADKLPLKNHFELSLMFIWTGKLIIDNMNCTQKFEVEMSSID